jgi:Choline/Carnitine o-acyltransferase
MIRIASRSTATKTAAAATTVTTAAASRATSRWSSTLTLSLVRSSNHPRPWLASSSSSALLLFRNRSSSTADIGGPRHHPSPAAAAATTSSTQSLCSIMPLFLQPEQPNRTSWSSPSSSSYPTKVLDATYAKSSPRSYLRTYASSSSNATKVTPSSVVLKAWPTPKVTCQGDYRQEAWLETHIGGPLYAHQTKLPRLPVPDVADTLQLLIPTALPLAETQEEAQNFQKAVEAFPSQSEHLQPRLKERAHEYHDSSWLQHWWNTWGYLDVRDPVTVNVSYFFHFADDSCLPSSSPRAGTAASASPAASRGAALLQASVEFRNQVCSGRLKAETVGRGDRAKTLDSTAYKYMFHATRIPELQSDVYDIHDPSLHRHAVVMCRGRLYSMDVCDPHGRPYSLQLLERGLRDITDRAAEATASSSSSSPPPELGWLTHSNRDDWATARNALLSKVPGAATALHTLESALLCLCLDDQARPTSRAECAWHFWHGGAEAGRNRWMDKSIQLIVAQNGKAGLAGEHSMCVFFFFVYIFFVLGCIDLTPYLSFSSLFSTIRMDGMPVVAFADYVTKATYGSCANSTDNGLVNVRGIFDGIDLRVMEPFVEKGASCPPLVESTL